MFIAIVICDDDDTSAVTAVVVTAVTSAAVVDAASSSVELLDHVFLPFNCLLYYPRCCCYCCRGARCYSVDGGVGHGARSYSFQMHSISLLKGKRIRFQYLQTAFHSFQNGDQRQQQQQHTPSIIKSFIVAASHSSSSSRKK